MALELHQVPTSMGMVEKYLEAMLAKLEGLEVVTSEVLVEAYEEGMLKKQVAATLEIPKAMHTAVMLGKS